MISDINLTMYLDFHCNYAEIPYSTGMRVWQSLMYFKIDQVICCLYLKAFEHRAKHLVRGNH